MSQKKKRRETLNARGVKAMYGHTICLAHDKSLDGGKTRTRKLPEAMQLGRVINSSGAIGTKASATKGREDGMRARE